MKTIYIISPSHVATGGTELLQQLCFYLNKYNVKSYMYYTEKYIDSAVEIRFKNYFNPMVDKIEDDSENIIIIPETRIDLLKFYKKAQIYIWWLSVDNYYGSGRRKTDLIHKIVYTLKDRSNSTRFKNCQHLVQSEYAKLYLLKEKYIVEENIKMLSDYLNHSFLDKVIENCYGKRKNNILYNPKKGLEFTKLLMSEITEYNWIPLQNLTPSEMQKLMQESKVYIDFGNHPGKDRIPRETAICGCCVITGRKGAAANEIDVPLKNKYKYDDIPENLKDIHTCISECMNYYEDKICDFSEYQTLILNEEASFCKTLKRIFVESE